MPAIQPRVIHKSDPGRLVIEWADGRRTRFTAGELRAMCPCARCVNEVTGQRMHDPSTVPADLIQKEVRLVGNYAVSIQFSDGHGTGIYTFQFLRERDPGVGA